jgi:hypothetical protein
MGKVVFIFPRKKISLSKRIPVVQMILFINFLLSFYITCDFLKITHDNDKT